MSYSISDTDFSLPSASCVSICNRRLFPKALSITVIFDPFFVGSEGLGIGPLFVEGHLTHINIHDNTIGYYISE